MRPLSVFAGLAMGVLTLSSAFAAGPHGGGGAHVGGGGVHVGGGGFHGPSMGGGFRGPSMGGFHAPSMGGAHPSFAPSYGGVRSYSPSFAPHVATPSYAPHVAAPNFAPHVNSPQVVHPSASMNARPAAAPVAPPAVHSAVRSPTVATPAANAIRPAAINPTVAARPANPAALPGNAATHPGNLAVRPGNPAAAHPGTPAVRPGNPAAHPGNPAGRHGNPAARPGNPAQNPNWNAANWNRNHYPWYNGHWRHGYYSYPYYGYGYGSLYGLGLFGFGPFGFGGFGPFGYGGYGYGYGGPYSWLGAGSYGYGYSNPYYYGTPGIYDYSLPLAIPQSGIPVDPNVIPDQANAEAPPVNEMDRELAVQWLRSARTAFANRDYTLALDHASRGIAKLPNDPVLHEFRALTQFALADYKGAAATLYPVISAGPGWDWDTLKNFYSDREEYVGQLRALERYQREHADQAEPSFVLAYHYLSLNEPQAAARQLENVVAHSPNDQLSKLLLGNLRKGNTAQTDRPRPQQP